MSAVTCLNVGVSFPVPRPPSLKEWVLRSRPPSVRQPFQALTDVSLTVGAGEAFGIIGGNGAGKSTLLRVIAGIIPPTRGEVTTRGRIAPIIELGTGFDHELTGRENIHFNGSLLGRSRAYMRACEEEIIDFAGISAFIDAPLRTYSTGMVARLAFAVATTVEADIVLLDEVLSVGDDQFTAKCNDRIDQFHATGATLILVSHSLIAIRQLCARVAWMDHGRMIACGPVDEVVDAYSKRAQSVSPEVVGTAG